MRFLRCFEPKGRLGAAIPFGAIIPLCYYVAWTFTYQLAFSSVVYLNYCGKKE